LSLALAARSKLRFAGRSFLAFVLSQAARPVFWLIDRLGIDPDSVREFLESLRRGRLARLTQDRAANGTALWQRILGLLVFVAIGWAIFRAIRRFGPEGGGGEPEPASVGTAVETALSEDPLPRTRPRLRREPPADRVRRWYAEALEALRRHGLAKDPALTPAEFEPAVTGSYPDVAGEFAALTRAYEDVRYGNLRTDRDGLERLEAGQRRLLRALQEPRLSPGDTMPDS